MAKTRSTTILGVIHNGVAAIGGDGQVTMGQTVMKHKSTKIRSLYKGQVLCGFAGSAADAFTLLNRFEEKLEQFSGNVSRAAVELASDWRTDKYLRRLEALLGVISQDQTFVLSGNGDVIEPDDNIVAIGSGGMYALSAARMLLKYSDLSTEEIVKEALNTAADICVYTNHNISVEVLKNKN